MRGSLARYRVTSGEVVVTARSLVHDTRATWPKVAGTLVVDPAEPAREPTGELEVDMRVFDAGDPLRNWKLRADMAPDRHPRATFRLERLEDVRTTGETVTAVAVGTLSWRGHEVALRVRGAGRLSPQNVEAEASFDLDVRTLGVEPPRVLMLKVESVVAVKVRFAAAESGKERAASDGSR